MRSRTVILLGTPPRRVLPGRIFSVVLGAIVLGAIERCVLARLLRGMSPKDPHRARIRKDLEDFASILIVMLSFALVDGNMHLHILRVTHNLRTIAVSYVPQIRPRGMPPHGPERERKIPLLTTDWSRSTFSWLR